jgi:hypothetical protein
MNSASLPQGSVQVRSSVPIFGLILMVLAAVVGGVIIGGIVAFVSQFFYLILLMPVLMAAAGGWIMKQAVMMGKVRSGAIAFFFGILIGLIIYGTYRFGEYYVERQKAHAELVEQFGSQVNSARIDEALDELFLERTGKTGFIGYTLFKAQEGESIRFGRSTSSSGGLNITLPESLTWIYWLVELLVIAGGAGFMAASVSSEPFCEQDGKFFTKRSLGRVQKEQADAFMTAAKAGDWSQVRSLISPAVGKPVYPYLEVFASKCPNCNTNPVELTAVRKMNSKSSNDMNVLKSTLTPEQYAVLDMNATSPLMSMA